MKEEQEKPDNKPPNGVGNLSPELQKILEEQAFEAEIQAAIDAAAEEGFPITREEAIKILHKKFAEDSPQP